MTDLEAGVRLLVYLFAALTLVGAIAGLIVAMMPPGDDPYENIPDPTAESEK